MPNVFIPLDGYIEDTVQNKKYKVGDLYITKVDEEHKQKKDITCIFDFDKRNVHLYLDNYKNNEEVINKLESVIYELQNKIINLINNSLREMFGEDGYKTYTPNGKDAGHMIWPDRQFIRYKNGDNKTVTLYKYISITINKISYELSYSRFFIDEDNRINCILCCPQLDRCTTKYVNSDGICYPTSYRGQDGSLQKIIHKAKDAFGRMTSYCFNPPCAGIDLKEIQFKKGENGEYLEDKKGNYILEADSKDYLYKYSLALENQFISFIVNNLGLNRINRIKNDLEHYEKELYINDKSDKLDDIYDFEGEKNGKVLDEKTGNCHFISKSLDLSKVSDEIFDCLKTIAKFINDGTYEYKVHKSNKGFVTCGKNLSYYDIFDYIQIKTDNKIYQLTPVRFAIDDNQKVIKSCLQSYQFLCADKEALVGRQSFRSWDIYPNSLEDGVETLLDMRKPCKKVPNALVFYHNPKTKFISKNDSNEEEWNKSIEEIAKEFLDFIKVNEGA